MRGLRELLALVWKPGMISEGRMKILRRFLGQNVIIICSNRKINEGLLKSHLVGWDKVKGNAATKKLISSACTLFVFDSMKSNKKQLTKRFK